MLYDIDANVPFPETGTEAGTDGPLDLNEPGNRNALAHRIHKAIEAYAVRTYDPGHRKHLGASLIGHECAFYLWATFRWFKVEKFSGRVIRLFQRGHLEENRFNEYLAGIGASVQAFQEGSDDCDKGTRQFRVKAVNGHFGGSLDGKVTLPPEFNAPEMMLAEYKTSGTGAGFAKLKEKGVQYAKPQHYTQMCVYGSYYGFKYALYICVNKNDDDLHVEIVPLSERTAQDAIKRAKSIIHSQLAPQKVSKSAAYFQCKYCNFRGVCFEDRLPEKNCRSCIQSTPIDGGCWRCEKHNATVPGDFIEQGCQAWRAITLR